MTYGYVFTHYIYMHNVLTIIHCACCSVSTNQQTGQCVTGSENVHTVQRVSDATTHRQQGGEDEESDDSEKVGTAILVLPLCPSREELHDIVVATKNEVLLTGSLSRLNLVPT